MRQDNKPVSTPTQTTSLADGTSHPAHVSRTPKRNKEKILLTFGVHHDADRQRPNRQADLVVLAVSR